MNKLKQLRRKLVRDVGVTFGIVAAFAGLLFLTDILATNAQQKKNTAVSQLGQDRTQLANLNNQFSKSGTAEKRFIDIALAHNSKDYSASSDAMKNLLRKAKEKYRFATNFKLTLAAEKNAERPEFSGLNYDVAVREPMRIDLEAISDLHVFSFIDYLVRNAPGLVRITKLDIKRKGDMDATALSKMNAGDAPALVEASMEFTWVGVSPKKQQQAAAQAPARAP